ncbi:uncharacterized protein CLUP02_04708 [Colletotrichum lupini]|uniref:Uncharacterized protein n=1 Tax=Colletotrichum lupini TaxID=145971 RepID=A0A9Q8SKV7_9PEZI|nr:uncharacterized protein CLUP02_04708 [Colletotrichum lupini]UQC79229.1 hypothetical protein CLUP02_04708 [Colletotrichum lupini]
MPPKQSRWRSIARKQSCPRISTLEQSRLRRNALKRIPLGQALGLNDMTWIEEATCQSLLSGASTSKNSVHSGNSGSHSSTVLNRCSSQETHPKYSYSCQIHAMTRETSPFDFSFRHERRKGCWRHISG